MSALITTVRSTGAQILTINHDHLGILSHYPRVVGWLGGLSGEKVFTGELVILPRQSMRAGTPGRVRYLSEFIDPYLVTGSCPEIKLGRMFGSMLLTQPLLNSRFLRRDFEGAVVHLAAHSMANMAMWYHQDVQGEYPARLSDYVISRPDSAFGSAYRYFWLADVGGWLGALETKMAACVAMMIAVLEGNPVAASFTRQHWIMIHEDLAPLDLRQSPWRELLVKPG